MIKMPANKRPTHPGNQPGVETLFGLFCRVIGSEAGWVFCHYRLLLWYYGLRFIAIGIWGEESR